MDFKEKAAKFGVILDDKQLEQFDLFYNLLIEKNKVMNLTGITEYDDVIDKHFVDSLSINLTDEFKSSSYIIDVGTGAGFPGIPLKIAFPEKKFVLMDSLNKRIEFINEIIGKLGLEGIETIHSRAEDLAKKEEYRQRFDICCSRAVSNLSTLSEYCIPFVKKGGFFISYKSDNDNVSNEIEEAEFAISLLGGKNDIPVRLELPQTDIGRMLIRIKKLKDTPKKYPRGGAKPSKEPLRGRIKN